ncbi:hypothetical protein GCM10010430_47560 [Kitasatospora cystarginea]|uniref:Uncharacterized protein n=1 Tax=Kitasatospora cystarginea TaxID=58350 RepID=A0ABP5RG71_9ACTN
MLGAHVRRGTAADAGRGAPGHEVSGTWYWARTHRAYGSGRVERRAAAAAEWGTGASGRWSRRRSGGRCPLRGIPRRIRCTRLRTACTLVNVTICAPVRFGR